MDRIAGGQVVSPACGTEVYGSQIPDSVVRTMHGRELHGEWSPAPTGYWAPLCPSSRKAEKLITFLSR